jgi:S1-C subfamily serine protease
MSTQSSAKEKIDQWFNRLAQNKLVFAATFALVTLSLGFIGGWLGASSRDHQAGISNNDAAQQVVLREGEIISQIVEEVGPSAVSVNVTSRGGQQLDIFGFQRDVERESAGTGVIISEDGIVITNRHVVPRGVTDVSVTLSDGTELTDVEVVGRTSESDHLDIAFLRIRNAEDKNLKAAAIGDSSEVKVGDRVVAIGNALGQFQNTVTSGIISGYGRDVQAMAEGGTETLQNLFQTDAAINQGNSGGPLVNVNGEVIGINTAVAGRAQNIGFAIPINDVKGLIRSVLDEGELQRPYLGVRYVTLTDDIAFQYNLETTRGAYIVPSGNNDEPSILPNSPAEAAGLREEDIITEIDGTGINQGHSLASLIGGKSVGDEVTLTVLRGNDTLTIRVTLQAAPEE